MDTWNVGFRLDIPKDSGVEMIMPGEQARILVTLYYSMPLFEGQKFTIRENQLTVGTGVITKLKQPIFIQKGSKLKHVVVPT